MSKITNLIFKSSPHYLTSKYGWRTYVHDGKTITNFHRGCDYGTNQKKAIQYAIEDGSVISAGKDNSGGIYAWIYYPRLDVKMLHYHLNTLAVAKGDVVKSGTKIGTTGTTGNSTGIHLHLGIYDMKTKTYLDPEAYADTYTEYVPEPEPDDIQEEELKVGDVVEFNGTVYVDSNGSKAGQSFTKQIIKITKVEAGAEMPYHVGQIGWVKAETVVKSTNITFKTKVVLEGLKKGDTVKIIGKGNGTSYGTRGVAGGIGYIRIVKRIYPDREYPIQVGLKNATTGFYKPEALEKIEK